MTIHPKFSGISSTLITSLTNTQQAHLSTTVIASMTTGQLSGLRSSDIAALTTLQLNAFTTTLISNLSTWTETPLYPKTFGGLMTCYAAGIPFLGNTILGDLFFSAALFGGYAWAIRQKWVTAQA